MLRVPSPFGLENRCGWSRLSIDRNTIARLMTLGRIGVRIVTNRVRAEDIHEALESAHEVRPLHHCVFSRLLRIGELLGELLIVSAVLPAKTKTAGPMGWVTCPC